MNNEQMQKGKNSVTNFDQIDDFLLCHWNFAVQQLIIVNYLLRK